MTDPTLIEGIQRRMRRSTTAAEERWILNRLAELDDAALADTMAAVGFDRLFAAIDNRVGGPHHFDELLELLEDRTWSVAHRAAMVRALQTGRTGPRAERAVVELFEALHGLELSQLKRALDQDLSHRNTLHLLYSDIDNKTLADRLVQHLGQVWATEPVGRKVLSDIDDTLYASLHDHRVPRGTRYPGVLAFYEALCHGPHSDLLFLSARPGDRSGLVERATFKKLRSVGLTAAGLLAGTFANLRSHDAMADGKYDNFVRFEAINREYEFVFVGDSGQGDAIFGAQIVEAHPSVRAVLIHEVAGWAPDHRDTWRERGVHPFDTYAGAARMAAELELITPTQASEVVERCVAETAEIPFASPEQAAAFTAMVERDAGG